MPAEYLGGLGDRGKAALQEFAAAGGTLVFLNHSTEYAIDAMGLKVRNVVSGAGEGSPARAWTERPERFASKSQKAQSSALRAAPAGIAACSSSRVSPASMRGRSASIAAVTVSTVSP